MVRSPQGTQTRYVAFLRFRTVFHLVIVQGTPRVAQTNFARYGHLIWMAEVDHFCIRRHPSVFQLAREATASIPFQVYHLPDGHVESFKSWSKRTLSV